jgi:LEA14-like dessication related protein
VNSISNLFRARVARRRLPRLTLPLSVALILLTGCAALQDAITPPEVELSELAIVGVALDRQDFRVGLLIDNPNPLPLPLEQVSFDIRLAGEGVLRGRSTEPMTLPARGQETLRLDVSSDLVSSVRRLLALAQGPTDALPYELTGEIALDRPLRRTLPFRTSGEVPLTVPAGLR